ncbi:MAG: hypothetical protein DRI95_03335 [Bacteroidetes bacterium]|nr:MAG: hypothetical protein DRI95_03335 [Bacteroidota bacterium]RLD74768.1 MAG: hypothetical protein DRJ07_19320 [Bacteroidota bacterium]
MQIKYFKDTDTLLIIFSNNNIVETKDLNENVLLETDEEGNIVSMTIEHAEQQTDVSNFTFNQILKESVNKDTAYV